MSSSSNSSIDRILPTAQDEVFNLEILVATSADGQMVARAANLDLDSIEATSIRAALGRMVEAAKKLIRSKSERGIDIPWVIPARIPNENEKRFLVPLHL